MSLEDDRAGLQPQTASGIHIGGPQIGPIGDLMSVDPHGKVVFVSHNGLLEPFKIAGDNSPRIDPSVDP